jgi:hypothetical protein
MDAQEYYIRHKDGRTVDSHAERQKVSRCLRSLMSASSLSIPFASSRHPIR